MTTMNRAAKTAASRGVHAVTPHLVCARAAQAIAFYRAAFGVAELMRLDGADGRVMHACLSINGSSVMVADDRPEMGKRVPTALKGTPVTIHLIVDDTDTDTVAERAAAAGARIVMPVADMFWGDRYGVLEDPAGHRWAVATPQREMTEADIRDSATAAMVEAGQP